jgi:hypothetical protein
LAKLRTRFGGESGGGKIFLVDLLAKHGLQRWWLPAKPKAAIVTSGKE